MVVIHLTEDRRHARHDSGLHICEQGRRESEALLLSRDILIVKASRRRSALNIKENLPWHLLILATIYNKIQIPLVFTYDEL